MKGRDCGGGGGGGGGGNGAEEICSGGEGWRTLLFSLYHALSWYCALSLSRIIPLCAASTIVLQTPYMYFNRTLCSIILNGFYLLLIS